MTEGTIELIAGFLFLFPALFGLYGKVLMNSLLALISRLTEHAANFYVSTNSSCSFVQKLIMATKRKVKLRIVSKISSGLPQ